MKKMVIPKQHMKFTVEVNAGENGVDIRMVRLIRVGKDECMAANAPLAKFDALQVSGEYVNCHELLQTLVEDIKNQLPEGIPVRSQVILKQRKVFGCK